MMSSPTTATTCFVHRAGATPLRPVPGSSSLSADGTATAPAPGDRGPGAWAPASQEPTTEELAAIEAEWPVIAAEVALVDAECQYLRRPSAATRAGVRSAEAAVIRAHIQFVAHTRPLAGVAS